MNDELTFVSARTHTMYTQSPVDVLCASGYSLAFHYVACRCRHDVVLRHHCQSIDCTNRVFVSIHFLLVLPIFSPYPSAYAGSMGFHVFLHTRPASPCFWEVARARAKSLNSVIISVCLAHCLFFVRMCLWAHFSHTACHRDIGSSQQLSCDTLSIAFSTSSCHFIK